MATIDFRPEVDFQPTQLDFVPESSENTLDFILDEEEDRPGILESIFEVPAAASRAAIREQPILAATGPFAGLLASLGVGGPRAQQAARTAAVRPETVPTFQEQAVKKTVPFETTSPVLNIAQSLTLPSLAISAAGLAADIITSPGDVLIGAGLGPVGRAVGSVRIGATTLGKLARTVPIGKETFRAIQALRQGIKGPILPFRPAELPKVTPAELQSLFPPAPRGPVSPAAKASTLPLGTSAELAAERAGVAAAHPLSQTGQVLQAVRTAETQTMLTPTSRPGLPQGRLTPALGSTLERLQVQFTDEFIPIQHFVTKIMESTGRVISLKEDPFVSARRYAGVGGRIENRLDDFGKILRPIRGHLEEFSEFLFARRSEELLARGIQPGKSVRIGRQTVSVDDPATTMQTLRQQLGEKRFAQMEETGEALTGFLYRLLDDMTESGLLSTRLAERIKSRNLKFVPFERLEFVADQMDQIPAGRRAFSVSRQDIIQGIKGSQKEADDPLNAIVRRIFKMTSLAERNRVAKQLIRLRELGAEGQAMIRPLTATEAPARGSARISAFINGVKSDYAVPIEVAEAMKGLNVKTVDMVTRFAGIQSSILRKGATGLNLAFALPNVFRDVKTALIASPVGFNPMNFLAGLVESLPFRSRSGIFRMFREHGGSFSGMITRFRRIPDTIREISSPQWVRNAKTITNPFQLLQEITGTFEQASRVGVFARAQRLGFTPEESAFFSRIGTIDFARKGTSMRIANLWIPFLTARIGGLTTTSGGIRQQPFRSAAVIGATTIAPVIATYLWNSRVHPDLHDQIPEWELDNNFVLITGSERNERNEIVPNYLKIPKAEIDKVFGNMTENFLRTIDNNDPKPLNELALGVLSDVSPIAFEKEGRVAPGVAISSLTPPFARGTAEVSLNRSLFTGRSIIPRRLEKVSPALQFTEKTTELAKLIGRMAGVSPILIEHFVRSTAGQFGLALFDPRMITDQVASRFTGSRGGAVNEDLFDLADRISRENADERHLVRMLAEQTLLEAQGMNPDAARRHVAGAMRVNPGIRTVMENIIEDERLGLTPLDRFVKSLPSEGRVRFVRERLQQLNSREAQADYLRELFRKKILTRRILQLSVERQR